MNKNTAAFAVLSAAFASCAVTLAVTRIAACTQQAETDSETYDIVKVKIIDKAEAEAQDKGRQRDLCDKLWKEYFAIADLTGIFDITDRRQGEALLRCVTPARRDEVVAKMRAKIERARATSGRKPHLER